MTKINRREFIKAGISVGAAGAMFSMGLPGSAWAAEGVPRKGGILKLGLAGGSSSDSYDPGSWSDTFTFIGFSAVYNSLVEIDVDGSAIPELAEGWTASEDARIWTFKLRSGIEFHNGKTMDADDVVASINHHRRDDSTSAAKTVLSEVKDVRATDQNTVVVELVAGNADFPYVMADYHIVIMPSKDGVADWKAGVGTGGYQLKEFNPGLRMVLARNPNYWKPGRAHFDGAELIGISDGAARVNALMTGEVDVINRVDLKTISLLKRNRQIVIEETKGAQHYTFPMLCDSDVFKNNDVRMALKHAVDREAMVKTILLGYGYAGNDHPI
uniref:ABC transporter substrate-binding protein n=1 Tax=Marinobacter sp. TaxID=50741 RepID=UPI0035632D0E